MSVIEVQLSQASIKRAISKLKKAKKAINKATDNYHEKCVDEAERKIDIVAQSALQVLGESSSLSVRHENLKSADSKTTIVSLVGEEAVFVEFGTGIVYNGPIGSTPHTQYDESYDNSQFSIGSWSLGPNGKRFLAEGDHWRHRHKKYYGWEPFEPITEGIKSVIDNQGNFARESFGSLK